MNMHKRVRLTPHDREEIWRLHTQEGWKVTALAARFRVSRPTIYKAIARARTQEFAPRKSTNKRFLAVKYGIKRLAKIERSIEAKKKAAARRYNKRYPDELMHLDTKRLPLLAGEKSTQPREYLFVCIDDFSRELYAAILPEKTQFSAAIFLQQVLDECPYRVEYAYSDNGKEYKGTPEHAFVLRCSQHGIGQKFTRVNSPQTNGKAKRVIRTLIDMWHAQNHFTSREERSKSLARFINFYNTVKTHKGIENQTPYEKLIDYFKPSKP